jgi:hypothetical protein
MAWADCLARYDEEFESDWSKLDIDSSQVRHPWVEKNRKRPGRHRKSLHYVQVIFYLVLKFFSTRDTTVNIRQGFSFFAS